MQKLLAECILKDVSALIDVVQQGSRDNMSVVIVAFEGAPKVSEEAKEKEAELDSRLELKVKGALKYYIY